MFTIRDPFTTEIIRDYFAKKNKDDLFLSTYRHGKPVIKDLNTKAFWDLKLSNPTRHPDSMAKRRIQYVANIINNRKGKFLNIGFGSLDLEKKLKHVLPNNIHGVDISKWAVDNATKNIKGTFLQASIQKLPFKNNFFNTVNASEVLEHLPADKVLNALGEINRVTKINGFIIVSVPLNEGLEEMITNGLNPNGHMRAYTTPIILKEIEVSGFSIRSTKHLFAFNRHYFLKNILSQTICPKRWEPNNIIVVAQKK